ncbi:hypothetical protein CS0771_47160 [Catellatospora sp. IY07-71]|uniref:hypothetical protein n=1 Tax=Catellatospora sp. IY07-71 TaxID=2728827 RepID=UPI001BB3A258|nr:hypothetical protein [Catellatospora sp. IY07-71]BCJ75172.1 hypothetical protein CS0771_47160 [Catellatospora sp. IY07-71]
MALLGLAASAASGPLDVGYAVPAGVTGAVLGALVTAAEDIAAVFRPRRAPS